MKNKLDRLFMDAVDNQIKYSTLFRKAISNNNHKSMIIYNRFIQHYAKTAKKYFLMKKLNKKFNPDNLNIYIAAGCLICMLILLIILIIMSYETNF